VTTSIDRTALVAEDGSWVGRRAFVDPEVYQREQESIFGHAWLFLGHVSQIPRPRDFITTYMGEEPVIVTRDSNGILRGFLNTCRHQGMRVCRADKGNTAAFTCSYHAWTYDTTGALIGVPKFQACYYGELDKSQLGLLPVRVEAYKGLIFGTFDHDAPTLVEYLGDIAWYLDIFLDRREGGTELSGGVHRWMMNSNWKVGSINNAGDNYHVGYAHASTRIVRRTQPEGARTTLEIDAHPGHTLVYFGFEGGGRRDANPVLQSYFDSIQAEAVNRLGVQRGKKTASTVGLVFPNFGWVGPSLRVYQPRGPHQTEMRSYVLVDKDAPAEVKAAVRRNYITSFGPSGILEQDDGENWTQVTASSRGPLSRNLEFQYGMGVGHEYYDENLPGRIAKGPSENIHRSFNRRWASEMRFDSRGGEVPGMVTAR
jgi:3-phenylpropionate/trans-cinnamate dioxygenase subunit alpha